MIHQNDLFDKIKDDLLMIERPGRYAGGEFGIPLREPKSILDIVVSYPDLYEIGMSNHAIRILYSVFNSITNVNCERVFAPSFDFEKILRQKKIPLYSLESKSPLHLFDFVCFSIGYELTLTNMLNILNLGNIDVFRKNRNNDTPIILAGGPGISNPAPIEQFVDCVFLGEAEDFVINVFPELIKIKKEGGKKVDLLEFLLKYPAIWSSTKKKKIRKEIFKKFESSPFKLKYPVQNLRIVQDHGVVEIMRGCINGCRFCHAGIYYRPCRMKNLKDIIAEIDSLIFSDGFREITLSSLSTGDFIGINNLIEILNNRYKELQVSFSLPSLKINSMNLSLLEGIAKVRKSGLTFAVETPLEKWQSGINKSVSTEKVIDLINEASKKGWKTAKFYFMIGLPFNDYDKEANEIIKFIKYIKKETKIKLNINISTFIPKPHTPFQWAYQLTEAEALRSIMQIKNELSVRNIKIGYHSPYMSVIEGLISRGDHRVGNIIYKAFQKGARLDAWEEHFNRGIWRQVIQEEDWNVYEYISQKRDINNLLPWDSLSLGVSKEKLLNEHKKAFEYQFSDPCNSNCNNPCGVCNNDIKINEFKIDEEELKPLAEQLIEIDKNQIEKIIISFEKKGESIYLSHLDLMRIFERTIQRSGFFARFSEGYNPKPKLEFANPLPLGIQSDDEIAKMELYNFDNNESFIERMNLHFPEGIRINKVKKIISVNQNQKIKSLMSLFWGSHFIITNEKNNEINKILSNKLSILEKKPDTPVYKISINNRSISIIWKKIEKKGYGIINYLRELLQEEPFILGFQIERKKSLILNNNQPVSYFYTDNF